MYFFYISLLYCYINITIMNHFCLSFRDIYLSFDISLDISQSFSFVTVSELYCCEWKFSQFLIFHYYTISFSGDVNLSLVISLLRSFVAVSELFCCEFIETLLILLVILLPIKSSVASAVF